MLYLVPTPIGNLEDITLRALRVLNEVDAVACEDTRVASVLLNHFDISKPTLSYHDHNERGRTPDLIRRMKAGETIALISDAGTPAISDPGFYLVRECVREGVPVEALPGATAFVPALVLSGLPNDRFVFEGFLPHKKGRATRIAALADEERTLVFYESPHRILKTLRQLSEAFGEDRQAAVCRELTKKFEEVVRGSLADIAADFESRAKIRGEIVLVVAGARS